MNASYQSGLMFSVIDDSMGSYPSECIERFVSLALRCCRDETDARPSMAEIVRELENIWRMTPEADVTRVSNSMDSENSKVGTPSSYSREEPYTMADISGSNLLSGVMPTISPR